MSEELYHIDDLKIMSKLKRRIRKELDKEPLDFGPQISYAIQFVKDKFEKIMEEEPTVKVLTEQTVLESSYSYILEVQRQANEKFPKLAILIRLYSSFFLFGAGLSFETELPLSQHMLPLVAGTLTKHCKSERNWWQECLDPGTEEIKNDCWKKIEGNPELFKAFKAEFKRLVGKKWEKREKDKKLFLTHALIVKLFLDKYISELICLNWDNLLELEYKRQTDHDIPKITSDGVIKNHSLWKLHGDVDDLNEDWVLPHRGGRIFNSLVEHLHSLTHPIFVIIGYSEREINISNELIAKLEKEHVTYRIRPYINPFEVREREKEIPCTARYAMKTISGLLK